MSKQCSSRAGFSAFSRHPRCCRCDLFVFVAAYERLPDLHDLFERLCRGRVAIGNSGSGRVDLDNRLNRDRVDREAIGYGSNRGRVDRVLIVFFFFFFFYPTKLDLYTIVFDQLDRYSTNTRSFSDGFSSAWLLDLYSNFFFNMSKIFG